MQYTKSMKHNNREILTDNIQVQIQSNLQAVAAVHPTAIFQMDVNLN